MAAFLFYGEVMIKSISEFIEDLENKSILSSNYLSRLREANGEIKSLNFKTYIVKKIDDLKFLILIFEPSNLDFNVLEGIEGDYIYIIDKRYNLGDIPELDEIIDEAILERATDIHIEPKPSYLSIRFRVDGDLVNKYQSNIDYKSIINKFKIFTNLDTMNREIQESSFEFKGFMIRVSSVPTLYGEKLVLRILQRSVDELKLSNLGLGTEVSNRLISICKKSGIHLICGPTGSGKNTTLHSIIKDINSSKLNIISIEDPVEYKNEFITQLEVDNKRERTFHKLLKAILRQDPDVLYIGEIRDEETAEVAMRSALTGHIVFSTLHTKDLESTFDRLMDLKVKKSVFYEAIKTIVNQRLVKRLCDNCKRKVEAPSEFRSLGVDYFYEAVGCDKCNGGYKGRVGVFDIHYNDDGDFKKMIDFNDSYLFHLKNGNIDFKTFEAKNDL